MALTPEAISRKHKKELQKLRRGRFSLLSLVFISIACLVVALALYLLVTTGEEQQGEFARSRQRLFATGAGWSEEFIAWQAEYRSWLNRYSLPPDADVFDRISSSLFKSATSLAGSTRQIGFLDGALISLHFAALRVAFILVACWKVWFFGILAAIWFSRKRWVPYRADNLMGQTGNGRIFYSGIRAALENLDETGAPSLLVTGLASPKVASAVEASTSEIAAVLKKYGAETETSLALARVLLAYGETPAYVATRDESGALAEAFAGESLPRHAARLLDAALAAHAALEAEPAAQGEPSSLRENLTSAEYAESLRVHLPQVLTRRLRTALKEVTPQILAVLVLAHEAGKVMAYSFEGGRWLRRSNFPQLCARSVLHSLSPFGRDFTPRERTLIRQALIYGSRKSVFAAVRLPINMTIECRAARQWVEVLMACPHELPRALAECELHELLREAEEAWDAKFFERLQAGEEFSILGTPSNLFLMPLREVMRISEEVVPRELLQRVSVLVDQIAKEDRIQELSGDASAEANERTQTRITERILPNLTAAEVKALSEMHQLPADVIERWSAMRLVLTTFAWLARRVGDYTVPPTYLIFAVVKPEERVAGVNELGLLGIPGVVPFRATRLAAKFGKNWSSHFNRATRAMMAETPERMAELLRGVVDRVTVEDKELAAVEIRGFGDGT